MTSPLTWTGKPVTISWSGIETWRDCQRKWAYGYIERKRTPNAATETGSKVHDLAEMYLKGTLPWDPATEEVPDEWLRYWRILEPGLLYAPTPEEVAAAGWGVETWIDQVQCGPLTLVGKVDIHHDPTTKIVDWKTTGDKDYRWSKTPKELAEHGQPLLYAYGIHHEDPPSALHFQHINMVTKGKPQAMEVWAYDVPWERAVEEFEKAKLIAQEMYDVAKDYSTADTVPANEGACRKFGGCSHAQYCRASPINRNLVDKTPITKGVTVQNTVNASDRIAALRAKLGIKGKASPITPTPAPPEPKAEPTKEDKVAKVAALYQKMVDDQGYVNEAVAKILADSEGLYVSDIIGVVGLTNQGGKFMPKPPATKKTPGEVLPGTEAKKLLPLAEEYECTVQDILDASDAKIMYGIVVPKDWEGTVTDMYQTFLPDTVEAAKAAIIDEVDPPAKESKDPEPEVLEPPKPRVAAEELVTQAAAPTTSVTVDEGNLEAALLVIQAIESNGGKPLPKPVAAGVVRQAIPSLKRIRSQRWDAIMLASEGTLYFQGKKVALAGAPISEAKAEAVKEVLTDARTLPERILPVPEELVIEPEALAKLTQAGDELASEAQVATPDASVSFRGPEVFVNCQPSGEVFREFSSWVATYERKATHDNKGNEWAHPQLMPYNDGLKAVLGWVLRDLDNLGPKALPPILVVDTSHWLAAAVLPLIERLGGSVRVIKAVR